MKIQEIGKGPRPDLYRERWVSLDGEWEFEFDDGNVGLDEQWYRPGHRFSQTILVPFCYQSRQSGVHDPGRHEVVWYRSRISVPDLQDGEHLWIHFGAVDYKATVWINGQYIMEHVGGHTPFSLRAPRSAAAQGEFDLVLRVEDGYGCEQPRGKQVWGSEPERCWYTPTTGIWQHVWMEVTGQVRIDRVRITPDIDRRTAHVEIRLSEAIGGGRIAWKLYFQDQLIQTGGLSVAGDAAAFGLAIEDGDPIDALRRLWSPSSPNLYVLELELADHGGAPDRLTTYFGMRKIETRDGKILLNNVPLYQRLVLDQGYWPDTLLTPPDDEALLEDVKLTLRMGFNGVRKHQKIEDPKYYYYADVYGLLVWNEMPSMYAFSDESMRALVREWQDVLEMNYNHPCIVTHVPLNESWGVKNILNDERQQHFAVSLYHLTKAIDGTRLVSTNDGWETVAADLCGIHDYEKSGEKLYAKYKDQDRLLSWTAVGKMIYANGFAHEGQPVLLSEFGGIALKDGNQVTWGYNDKAGDGEELLERIEDLVSAIHRLDYIQGYCYTQLTDVEQETNGLLYPDRRPKVDLDRIKRIFER